MIKESWGTKQTCPKCGARFYDLGKADPVICIECENSWVPEPILKSKQPIIAKKIKPVEPKEVEQKAVITDDDGEIIKAKEGEESEEEILAKEGLDIEIEDDGNGDSVDTLSLDDDDPNVAEVIDAGALKTGEGN